MEHIPCALCKCAEIDVNATPSDFDVNYYIRLSSVIERVRSVSQLWHTHIPECSNRRCC